MHLMAENYLDPTNTRPRRWPSAAASPRTASAPSPPNWPASPLTRRSSSTQRMDRFPRRDARDDEGPPGQLSRHARHLRPCQRLPDLPRAARAADPAGHGRGARRLPLQTALSQARHSAPETTQPRHPGHAARRPAPGLRPGPGGSAPEGRRHARAHRQGVHLGKPDVGPWADAHGDLQRPCGRSVQDRHALSSTWPTCRGIRR